MVVVGASELEEGGDWQIIDLMQNLVSLDHVSTDSSFRQGCESYLLKLLFIRTIETRYHPYCPSLDSFQHIDVLLKVRGPALHHVLEMTNDINSVQFDEGQKR